VHASHEVLTLARPAREVRVLKRHGVGEREGELGADFSSIVLSREGFSRDAERDSKG
jgi:hypothetical protein